MVDQNLHQALQQASQQINEAQEAVIQAQGNNNDLLELAKQQLQQAEQGLQQAQNQSGTEATENSQFQQAYEKLHDTRQQIQEVQQNINKFL